MSELEDSIWTIKYRPDNFDDLILEEKNSIINFINSKSIPSFLFYSNRPGTGKTSCAKLIISELDCDSLIINSSKERGIDIIRDKISTFASSLSSNPNTKRCVFLDEADGLTGQAQDSLKNLMETYSDNCFFIFSCNDFNKIIEPIRSRCDCKVNFGIPNKTAIKVRLEEICELENYSKYTDESLDNLITYCYPDMRSMIGTLQTCHFSNKELTIDTKEFEEFLSKMKSRDTEYIYKKVFSGTFKIMDFNKWIFKHIYDNCNKFNFEQLCKMSRLLADTEKSWTIGANLEVIFLANIMKVMEFL